MPKSRKLDIPYVAALEKELAQAPRPKLSQIATDFITLSGGPRQFAKHLWAEYNAAEDGSLARQRIMQMIFMCMKQDDDGYDPTALDGLEYEDLLNIHKTLYGVADGGVQNPADPQAEGAADEQIGDEAGLGAEAGSSPEEAEPGEDGGPEEDIACPV